MAWGFSGCQTFHRSPRFTYLQTRGCGCAVPQQRGSLARGHPGRSISLKRGTKACPPGRMASKGKHEAGGKERDPVPNSFNSLFEVLHATSAQESCTFRTGLATRARGQMQRRAWNERRGGGARARELARAAGRQLPVSLGVPEPAPGPPFFPRPPPGCWPRPSSPLPGHRRSPPRRSPSGFGNVSARAGGVRGAAARAMLSALPFPSVPAVLTMRNNLHPLFVARDDSNRDSYTDILFSKKSFDRKTFSPAALGRELQLPLQRTNFKKQIQCPNGFVLHYLIVIQLISNA